MAVKVMTKDFKEILKVANAFRANNALLPLTTMYQISVDMGTLELRACGTASEVACICSVTENDKFSVVIEAGVFTSIINKQDCEFLTFEVDNCFKVKGNGNYKFDIVCDDEGDINFPPFDFVDCEGSTPVDMGEFEYARTNTGSAIETKPGLLNNYSISEGTTIATDNCFISRAYNEIPFDIVLPKETMDSLCSLTGSANAVKQGNKIYLDLYKYKVICDEADGAEMYPLEQIKSFLDNVHTVTTFEVDRNELVSLLSRVTLFTQDFDHNAITVTGKGTTLSIESKTKSGVETMAIFADSEEDFTILVDAKQLMKMLSGFNNKIVTMVVYEGAVGVDTEDATAILALLEE